MEVFFGKFVQTMTMRLLLFLVILMFPGERTLLAPFPPQDQAMKMITGCLRKGDARTLSGFFTSTIDIGLPEKDNSYSAAQGELVMKEFFKKYPPSDFTVNQQESPSGNTYYTIGTYVSGSRKFKTLVYLKKEENDWKIHKLKFEEIKSQAPDEN